MIQWLAINNLIKLLQHFNFKLEPYKNIIATKYSNNKDNFINSTTFSLPFNLLIPDQSVQR